MIGPAGYRSGLARAQARTAPNDDDLLALRRAACPIRALPILRVPGTGREPELNERQLHARRRVHEALEALGGLSSPAGSCVWHVVGLQRSVREWAMRQGWGGRAIDQKQAQGILVAALGVMTASGGRSSHKAGQSPVRVDGGGRE